MPGKSQVTVEFFGIPRQRAGRAELIVHAETVGELLAVLEKMCPALGELVGPDGYLSAHYLLSFNGETFIRDPNHRLSAGEKVLLLSADVGG